MERLTGRVNNKAGLKGECAYFALSNDTHTLLRQAIDKLADYEDAEEQGLLVRLPCRAGDTVYDIDFGKPFPCMVTGFSYGRILEDEDDDYHEEPVIYCVGSGVEQYFGISEFGKTVFLTRAETEQALEKMKEGEC